MRLGTVQRHVIRSLGISRKVVGDIVEEYAPNRRESGYASVSRALSVLKNEGVVMKDDNFYTLTDKGMKLYKELFPEEWKENYSKDIRGAVQHIMSTVKNPERQPAVQKIVFAYFGHFGRSTLVELSEALGMDQEQCGYVVAVLYKMGLLELKPDNSAAISQDLLSSTFDAALNKKKTMSRN